MSEERIRAGPAWTIDEEDVRRRRVVAERCWRRPRRPPSPPSPWPWSPCCRADHRSPRSWPTPWSRAPWEPSDFRWHAVAAAAVGAAVRRWASILLGRRVVSTPGAGDPGWSGLLARAAVAIGAVCATLASVALLSGILPYPLAGGAARAAVTSPADGRAALPRDRAAGAARHRLSRWKAARTTRATGESRP